MRRFEKISEGLRRFQFKRVIKKAHEGSSGRCKRCEEGVLRGFDEVSEGSLRELTERELRLQTEASGV